MRLSEAYETYQLLNNEIENFGWPAEAVDGLRDSKLKLQSLQDEDSKIEAQLKVEEDIERRRTLKARRVDISLEIECTEAAATKFHSRMSERQAHKNELTLRRDRCAKILYEAPAVSTQAGVEYSDLELARVKTDEIARQIFNQQHNAANVSGRAYREHHRRRAAELRQALDEAKQEEQRLPAAESEARA